MKTEKKYEGHLSDCSTNNRGVPEMLGPCDCGYAEKPNEMKLSEELKQLHDCGDVGGAVEGCSDAAKALEDKIDAMQAPTDSGIDELDRVCRRFNNGEINMTQLVCTIWNESGCK